MGKSQKVRLYYGIFLTVLTVAVGVAFIVAVSQVYYKGIADNNADYPFEIARIREHILVPFILLLCEVAAIIGGVILWAVFPVAKKKKALQDSQKTLERLKERIPVSGGEEYAKAKTDLRAHEIARLVVWCIALAVFLAAAVAIFVYAFNLTNYHTNALKADIMNLVKNVLSWTVAALGVGIIAIVADEILLKKELAAAKAMIVSGDREALPPKKEVTKKAAIGAIVAASIIVGVALLLYVLTPVLVHAVFSMKQSLIYFLVFAILAVIAAAIAVYHVVKRSIPEKVNRILLIVARAVVGAAAVTFILVGIFNGGANDVLVKAIYICTECIGLG